MTREAIWEKGERTITGRWQYNWSADSFTIWVDVPDEIIGEETRTYVVYGDDPEFNGWELQREGRGQR